MAAIFASLTFPSHNPKKKKSRKVNVNRLPRRSFSLASQEDVHCMKPIHTAVELQNHAVCSLPPRIKSGLQDDTAFVC